MVARGQSAVQQGVPRHHRIITFVHRDAFGINHARHTALNARVGHLFLAKGGASCPKNPTVFKIAAKGKETGPRKIRIIRRAALGIDARRGVAAAAHRKGAVGAVDHLDILSTRVLVSQINPDAGISCTINLQVANAVVCAKEKLDGRCRPVGAAQQFCGIAFAFQHDIVQARFRHLARPKIGSCRHKGHTAALCIDIVDHRRHGGDGVGAARAISAPMPSRGHAIGHPTRQVGYGCAYARVTIGGIGRAHYQPHRGAAPCRPSDKSRARRKILPFQRHTGCGGIDIVDQAAAKRADGGVKQIHRLPALLGAQAVGGDIIPDIAIFWAIRIPRSHRHVNPARRHNTARGCLDRQASQKGRAIGTDFQNKVIVAHNAHFRTARIASLKQQAGGVRGFGLVDLDLMPRPRMGKKCGGRGDGQPIGIIGICRNAQGCHPLGSVGRGGPVLAVKHRLGGLIFDPDAPSCFGHIEIPIQARINRHMAIFALPIARGPLAHDVTGPRGDSGGRGGQTAAAGRSLHQNVQNRQSLVMGDVFLGLGRFD